MRIADPGTRPPDRRNTTSSACAGRRRSRGQAIAEFALVAPVVLLLMLVAVDFGRLFFTFIAVNNAAREASYYAAMNAADTPFDEAAYNAAAESAALRETNAQAQGGAGTMSVSQPICFTPPSTAATLRCDLAANFAGGIGNQVMVTASQPFAFLTPLIGDLFGGQLNLSASATAPIMNPAAVAIQQGPSLPPVPTASPSPTPSPTPTPSPGPTLPPGATPSPSPSPSPTPIPMCSVPNFKNGFWNNVGGVPALQVWHDQAGFTGTLVNRAGDNTIKDQQINRNDVVPCSTGMWVDD